MEIVFIAVLTFLSTFVVDEEVLKHVLGVFLILYTLFLLTHRSFNRLTTYVSQCARLSETLLVL